MSKKTPGYCGSSVYDPLGRGVTLAVVVRAEGVKDPAHVISSRLYPKKQAEGTVSILKAENYGNVYEVQLMIGAAKLQYGGDAVKAVSKAANVPIDNVHYASLGGVTCFATNTNPGSPRTGTVHKSRKADVIPHR